MSEVIAKAIAALWVLVAVALIVARIGHAITWSWWLVLAPVEIAIAILASYVAVFMGLVFFADWR